VFGDRRLNPESQKYYSLFQARQESSLKSSQNCDFAVLRLILAKKG
jgi:hypothetical protein